MEASGGPSALADSDTLRELYFRRLQSGPDSFELSEDRELVRRVISRAVPIVAHPSRPFLDVQESFQSQPMGEIDIEATLEESWDLSSPESIQVRVRIEKPFHCVAMLDCSSSMSGDKHLTASVAVAVLLLRVALEDVGVVVFHSTAQAVRSLGNSASVEKTVLDFLSVRPKGFTNIAAGLGEGLALLQQAGGKRRIGLLATDGRGTQGADPADLAKRFDCLVVLHLHGAGSFLEGSQALAAAGNGLCLEVEAFEDLPRKMYEAIRLIARR